MVAAVVQLPAIAVVEQFPVVAVQLPVAVVHPLKQQVADATVEQL